MPRRFKRKAKRSKVRLPQPPQSRWKKLAGVASNVADSIAMLPGPVGIVGKAIAGIKNLINVESKFVDTTISQTPDATTGVITALTLSAQGATDSTRNGNTILAKSIDLKLTLTQHASASTTFTRIMLVLDKQNAAGTAPTIAQILQSAAVQSFNNMNTSDRFVKLKDTLEAQALVGDSRVKVIEWHQDLSDLHVKYDGTAADQGSAAENHVYLVSLSSEGTNVPSLSGSARFRYYDN